jgi:hypothetical protein
LLVIRHDNGSEPGTVPGIRERPNHGPVCRNAGRRCRSADSGRSVTFWTPVVSGVPADLDLSVFREAILLQICLGEHLLQFHFHPRCCLVVQGGWSLLDPDGRQADAHCELAQRECYRLHHLLGQEVVTTEVQPPSAIVLCFSNGWSLRVLADSEPHESFQIHPGDVAV